MPEPNGNGAGGASESKKISMDEVQKHNTEDDCWLAIKGKVYDVTPFLTIIGASFFSLAPADSANESVMNR